MRRGWRLMLLLLLSRADCVCQGYPGSPLRETEIGLTQDLPRPELTRDGASPDAGPRGWAVSAGGTADDRLRAVTVDGAGNVVIAGLFTGRAKLGEIELASTQASGLFVAKLDAEGTVRWATTLQGGFAHQDRDGLATDEAGNIYYATSFTGSAEIGIGRFLSKGSSIAVVKLDPEGHFVWSVAAGTKMPGPASGPSSHACCLAIDATGELIVAGRFSGSLDFGEAVLTAKGGSDLFVARVDPSGRFTGAVSAGSDSPVAEAATGLVLDGRGNAYITGHFSGTVSFDGHTITARDTQEVFVAKLDPSLSFLWARQPHWATPFQRALAIDRDQTALYVGGSVLAAGIEEPLVMKLDDDKFHWNQTVGATGGGGSASSAVTALLAGRGSSPPIVAGDFTGTATFSLAGSAESWTFLTSSGDQDIFLATLGEGSHFLGAARVGGGDRDWVVGLASDGEALYVAGHFQGSAILGGTTLISRGDRDLFLWKTTR